MPWGPRAPKRLVTTTKEFGPVDGGVAEREDGGIAEAIFGVIESVAGEVGDPAAGGFDDALGRGCVPLHGGDDARVEVGFAFGDQTEFQRTAHTGLLGVIQPSEKCIYHGTGVIAAGNDRQLVQVR